MAPLDPQQLLKALNDLLGPSGEISGSTEAVRVASLMKDANKLVSKCVYINILKVETPADIMEKLISAGGWETLNLWLQETKDDENYPFLIEILKVYQLLPVTVDILKTNNAAKTIKQLCKSENESVKTLATNIFDVWMKKVKGNNNNNDDKSKKKKEKGREKDSEKKDSERSDKSDKKDGEKSDKSSKKYDSSSSSSSSSSKSDSKSKSRDSKHSQHDTHRDRDREKKSSKKERDRKMEEENMDTSSNESVHSDDKVIVRKGDGLKLHIRLGGDKDKTDKDSKTEETTYKRPSTVKRPPSKFRSTGCYILNKRYQA